MLSKSPLKTLLSLAIFIMVLVFVSSAKAQEEPTFCEQFPTVPECSPSLPCQSTIDSVPSEWSAWTYSIGGGSRSHTRTIPTFDGENGDLFCGNIEETETEYSWCVSGVDSEDGFGTFWYPDGQEPESATPGQCESHQETTTICYQGETLEVELELLGQYEGSEPGSCLIPTPTPTSTPDSDVCDNIDGIQTSVPEGLHLDASQRNCVSFSDDGGGNQSGGGSTTSTGQVLGASTLADTGMFSKNFGLGLMVFGLALTASSFYALKRRQV